MPRFSLAKQLEAGMIIDISKLEKRQEALEEAKSLLEELRRGAMDWSIVMRLRHGLRTPRDGPEAWAFSREELGLVLGELDSLAHDLRLRIAREAIARQREGFYLRTIIDHFAVERALEDGVTIEELELTPEEIEEVEQVYGSLELAAQLKG